MNCQNDILRYLYRVHLTEAKGADPKTVEGVMRHLAEYEVFTGFKTFNELNKAMIIEFKEHLMSRPAKTGGAKLSASSVVHTLSDLQAFFTWLRKEGRGRKFSVNLLDYFAPLRRTAMTARSRLERPVPSPDDIRAIIEAIPVFLIVERRDRALVAFLFLTGMRDAAAISIRIKHIDLGARLVIQNASEVHTKFGKNMKPASFQLETTLKAL